MQVQLQGGGSISPTLRKAAWEAAGIIPPASHREGCPTWWVLPFSWPTAALGAPEWPEVGREIG